MDSEEQATFDTVQAEKKEIGIVDETIVEEEKPKEEAPKTEEKPEPKAEDDADDENDSDEDEDESEDDDEDKDEDEEPEDSKPDSVRKFKQEKKSLREELQKDFDQKLEKMKQEFEKKAPSAQKSEDLEAEVEALAKELDFDKDKVRKIIEVARKGLEMSAEDKALLQELKESKDYIVSKKEEDFMREQENIFLKEWNDFNKPLKEQYPNASDEQIAKAREEMDKISHSEKYHKLNMVEILAAKKATFDKILFSPKQATFETGRPAQGRDEFADEMSTADFLATNPTPAQFEAFEKRRENSIDESPKEKTRIRTRNDRGDIVEREE